MSSELLPPNSTAQERAIADVTARDSVVPVPIRETWDPDSCPVEVLPWLAWAFSVDTWDAAWSEQEKRAAIRSAVAVHKYKGTIGAVREALAGFDIAIGVQEWFNQLPTGDPYTFLITLELDQRGLDINDLQSIHRVIQAAKNLRSHLSSIAVRARSQSTLVATATAGTGGEITVAFGGNLLLDGTWRLDGIHRLNGIKVD